MGLVVNVVRHSLTQVNFRKIPRIEILIEYCLQCSILDNQVDAIYHRLRGLCDNVPKEAFIDHEISYSLTTSNNQSVSLRVSRSLAQSKMPWQLKYIGAVEAGNKVNFTLEAENKTFLAESDAKSSDRWMLRKCYKLFD